MWSMSRVCSLKHFLDTKAYADAALIITSGFGRFYDSHRYMKHADDIGKATRATMVRGRLPAVGASNQPLHQV